MLSLHEGNPTTSHHLQVLSIWLHQTLISPAETLFLFWELRREFYCSLTGELASLTGFTNYVGNLDRVFRISLFIVSLSSGHCLPCLHTIALLWYTPPFNVFIWKHYSWYLLTKTRRYQERKSLLSPSLDSISKYMTTNFCNANNERYFP